MTVKLLLVKSENGLETRQDYDGLSSANPAFTGTLSGQSARFYDLAGPGDGVTICDSLGNVSRQTIEDFRDATLQVIPWSAAGVANGVAKLDPTGRVPSGQLPSYVDDVLEYANFAAFPATGETGKIYVNLDQNKTWRWSGSGYVEISASLALGETSSTAYRGDRGKTAYDHSQISSGNPHNSTPADLGALTAHNPTFTGTLSGPHALLSGVGLFKEDAGNATRGSWYGVGVTPGTNNFAFRAADDGSVAEMNGSSNIGLAIGGTNKVVIGSTAVAFQSGVGLIIADETVISDQREAALYSAQVDALAGAGKGLVLCEADGDLYREALDPATIGAAASAGVTDGSDAASGVVGQYYEAFLPEASFVYAVNGSPVAVLSLSLPAGDWLVEGRATAYITGAMNGNKVVSGLNTSIAIPTDGTEIYGGLQVFSATNGFQTMTGSKRFSLTATTTVYLVAQIDFSAGTPALFGCMSARRMR